MSEVTAHLRQGDICRGSCKVQKRPLSIITENDNDDFEPIDYMKCQEPVDRNGKENSSCHNNASESHKTCKVTETEAITNCSNCLLDKESSSYATSFISNTQSLPLTAVLSGSTSQQELNLSSTTIENILQQTESSGEITERFSHQQDKNKASLSVVKPENTRLSPVAHESFVHCDNIHTSKSCGADQGLTRIRKAAEPFHLTLPLLSASLSTSNGNAGNKMGQRIRSPTSIKTSKDARYVSKQTLQRFTNGSAHHLVNLKVDSSPDIEDFADSKCNKILSEIIQKHSCSQTHVTLGNSFQCSKYQTPKLSSYFSRRMSNESTGSLSESDLSDGEAGSDDSLYLSHFRRLKETTDKLLLSTRRPSIMQWKQKYLESPHCPRTRTNHHSDNSDEEITFDRRLRIDKDLDWLRAQLQEMRSQDQNLAKQLLAIRQEMHKLKLQRSTEEHQELIDDFHFELQELQEFSDILDMPLPEYGDNPLKHIGVTRLNISARRFSAC